MRFSFKEKLATICTCEFCEQCTGFTKKNADGCLLFFLVQSKPNFGCYIIIDFVGHSEGDDDFFPASIIML